MTPCSSSLQLGKDKHGCGCFDYGLLDKKGSYFAPVSAALELPWLGVRTDRFTRRLGPYRMRFEARFPTLVARFFLLGCPFIAICAASSNIPRSCSENDGRALLEFKQSISLNKSASSGPLAYPKMLRWGVNEPRANGTDCCSWDGVDCDEQSGRVVGLDLSSSFLYGPIDSTSSLFRLLRLRELDISDNNFVNSEIPAAVGRFSHLVALNLSFSGFYGQIPMEILENLTSLTSLDLSNNLLNLHHPSFGNLVQNLTALEDLSLSMVDISSEVPDILANFTSLRSILLEGCRLSGEFPAGIFRLPKLQFLSVRSNQYLTGRLPEFRKGNPLQVLKLSYTSFSGMIPESIRNLQSVTYLDLGDCFFHGSLPASLDNLTQLAALNLGDNNFTGRIPSLASLSRLQRLSFSSNNFEGWNLPEWLSRLTELRGIYFDGTNLFGEIPPSLANLTQLNDLFLYSNLLTGHIPSQLTNMTQMVTIDLTSNQLQGPLPPSVSNLENLQTLDISLNNLSGTVEIDIFRNLTQLSSLQLSGNWINLVTVSSTTKNLTFPKLTILGLGRCNLNEFPEFLRYQDKLEMLFMEVNQIQGPVPEWLWNGTPGLTALLLTNNLLTGFEQSPFIIPWNNLQVLELSNNMIEGSLPIPPPSTRLYQISNNRLTGEIPPQICLASGLTYFDISNNSLSGTIPLCLGNFSSTVIMLNLGGNSFSGAIPNTFAEGSNLKMMDFSGNQLFGPLPTSLANCSLLQILELNDNQLEDLFPSWLGALPELQVLILRFNKLYGSLTTPSSGVHFPNLRIMDLSHNALTGDVPEGYFHGWNTMKIAFIESTDYLKADNTFTVSGYSFFVDLPYSITITNKGVQTGYVRILTILTSLDLSGNKFEGQIPESIGQLLGLESLNLSDNHLTGQIPSSLQNLRNLESLDLCQNMLSGEIPQSLAELSFLAFINVSYNYLTGPIPQGQQLDTFMNTSYEGNPGLCGEPLSRKCSGTSTPSSIAEEEDDDSDFPSGIVDWIVIFTGFASGLAVGIIIGQGITRRHHEWFVSKFGRKKNIHGS